MNKSCVWWDASLLTITVPVPHKSFKLQRYGGTAAASVTLIRKVDKSHVMLKLALQQSSFDICWVGSVQHIIVIINFFCICVSFFLLSFHVSVVAYIVKHTYVLMWRFSLVMNMSNDISTLLSPLSTLLRFRKEIFALK